MWQVRNNNEIDDFCWSPKGTSLKTGSRAAWGTAISAYPLVVDGYNQFFDIACEGINLRFETAIQEFDLDNKSVIINGEKENYDIIVKTISPDIYLLSGDVGFGLFDELIENNPEHFIHIGIAEQNMIIVLAGLAAQVITPFVCTIIFYLPSL